MGGERAARRAHAAMKFGQLSVRAKNSAHGWQEPVKPPCAFPSNGIVRAILNHAKSKRWTNFSVNSRGISFSRAEWVYGCRNAWLIY